MLQNKTQFSPFLQLQYSPQHPHQLHMPYKIQTFSMAQKIEVKKHAKVLNL
ncbi:hypothetical protein HanIR_Chr08g0379381 [Helianthus annuus]|nr:hypothetical protein HanIR_Chr08g0379381 [Helianthus annuus]